jgi:hypothetical protein
VPATLDARRVIETNMTAIIRERSGGANGIGVSVDETFVLRVTRQRKPDGSQPVTPTGVPRKSTNAPLSYGIRRHITHDEMGSQEPIAQRIQTVE